jgi:hypothetical protein
MNRCSFLLSQGKFVADALYYYGDDTPNFVFLKEEVTDLGYGYDWDKCSLDVLLQRVRIKNGLIVLPDGMTYSILVIPSERAINPDLLRKLDKLVREGLILVGPKPEKATGLRDYPESDREVKNIAERIWGEIDSVNVKVKGTGKGKVIWGLTPGETLKSLGIEPDFSFSSATDSTQIEYIHRSAGQKEIYFVVNRLARFGIYDTQYRYLTDLPDRYEEVICKFRITGKVPELWDPMTGEIKQIAVYKDDGDCTYIPLHLNPEGSVFVVFVDQPHRKHIVRVMKEGKGVFPEAGITGSRFPALDCFYSEDKVVARFSQPGNYSLKWSDGSEESITCNNPVSEIRLTSNISLKFIKSWGPEDPMIIEEFKSWTDFSDKRIRYYSGPAEYSTTFSLEKVIQGEKRFYLDLGNVQEIAEVWVNEEHAGVSWIAPFILDINEFVTEGENKLRVRVVNSWANRLIGDSYLSKEQRYTRTNVLKFEGSDKEQLLRKSGLTDTIKIISVSEKKLQFIKN